MGSKWGPKCDEKCRKIESRARVTFWSDFGQILDQLFIDSRSQFRMKIENFVGGFSRQNFIRILMNFYIPKKAPTFKNHWFFQYKLMNFTCWLHSGSHQTTIPKSTILGPKNIRAHEPGQVFFMSWDMFT